VDLGLTNGRLTTFLGVVLGVLAVLRQIEQEDPPAAIVTATEEADRPALADRVAAGRPRRVAWSARPVVDDPTLDDDPPDAWREQERPAGERPDGLPAPAGAGRA
jgi:hypothetical protein